mmetsp:Transcript_16797/g.33693  ORF Transcript_16797/g.33693 Transcript_16797/m.33693 type:complete len:137 (-) Transcript_16797:2112-2522(-)
MRSEVARFRADRESSDYENILKNCKFEEEVDISRPSPSSTWPTLDEIEIRYRGGGECPCSPLESYHSGESRESFQLSIHDRALLSSFGDLPLPCLHNYNFFFFHFQSHSMLFEPSGISTRAERWNGIKLWGGASAP